MCNLNDQKSNFSRCEKWNKLRQWWLGRNHKNYPAVDQSGTELNFSPRILLSRIPRKFRPHGHNNLACWIINLKKKFLAILHNKTSNKIYVMQSIMFSLWELRLLSVATKLVYVSCDGTFIAFRSVVVRLYKIYPFGFATRPVRNLVVAANLLLP